MPFVEGMTTDLSTVDTERIKNLQDVTVTLELNNGKVVVFKNASYAAEGDTTTEEGEIQLRFEALEAEVIAGEAV